MDRLQGAQRHLQSIFNLNRRKKFANFILKRYSKAKTLGKASIRQLGVGYKYISYKIATDESARYILAALLLVILSSWVITAIVERRRRKSRSQAKRQQQQKEKLAEVDSAVVRTLTPFKPIPKVNENLPELPASLINQYSSTHH
jgi:hypothetical protein